MPNNTNHASVISGKATYTPLGRAAIGLGGGGGTMGVSMAFSLISTSILAANATGTAVRALWVMALAAVVLWIIDRSKPATPRRAIPVRVDKSKTPLYREPERNQRLRALANLSAGSVIVAGLVAVLVTFVAALVLEVVGGLLGN